MFFATSYAFNGKKENKSILSANVSFFALAGGMALLVVTAIAAATLGSDKDLESTDDSKDNTSALAPYYEDQQAL